MTKSKWAKFFAVIICLLLNACTLMEISQQVETLDNLGVVAGQVELEGENKKPVYVQLFRYKQNTIEIITSQAVADDGSYQLRVLPGEYMIMAFVDDNKDAVFQRTESANYLTNVDASPEVLVVSNNSNITPRPLIISGPLVIKRTLKDVVSFNKPSQNIGRIVDLEDPMFSRKSAMMGFWRSLEYIKQYGGGLMMLQEYDESKVPVIFIHGIMGTSYEFKKIISALDKDKFQPWVLHYASGIRLDMVSDYLIKSLDQLHHQYGFSHINIVAHSMGGLMTRSFVMKHQQNNKSYQLKAVVTINSPLYGMDSAASGVEMSPIIIPAWRDVASNSDYVKRVHQWQWPKDIAYHLVFSYLPEEDGDGVVPLKSQLSQSLQDEASAIYGFQAQHAAILTNDDFIERLNRMILP